MEYRIETRVSSRWSDRLQNQAGAVAGSRISLSKFGLCYEPQRRVQYHHRRGNIWGHHKSELDKREKGPDSAKKTFAERPQNKPDFLDGTWRISVSGGRYPVRRNRRRGALYKVPCIGCDVRALRGPCCSIVCTG